MQTNFRWLQLFGPCLPSFRLDSVMCLATEICRANGMPEEFRAAARSFFDYAEPYIARSGAAYAGGETVAKVFGWGEVPVLKVGEWNLRALTHQTVACRAASTNSFEASSIISNDRFNTDAAASCKSLT